MKWMRAGGIGLKQHAEHRPHQASGRNESGAKHGVGSGVETVRATDDAGHTSHAIDAGVPTIPMCTSTFKNHLQFNKWHSGTVKIRSLPALTTTGLTLDDIPALVKQCRDQMLQCIAEMDLELENC